MRKIVSIISCLLLFCMSSCMQTDSHPDYDEKNSVQLYIKNFSPAVRHITADLVSDDIKIIGDTKGETYVIVRTYGSGITDMSIDDLQKRADKYYDIQVQQEGADELHVSVKPKIKIITPSEGLSFYFEVHTNLSSSADIKNVSGSADIEQIASLKASSVSGDINLKNITGSASAVTTSGDINGDNIGFVDNLSSVSGDVKMKINSLVNDAEIKTTSGDIHLQIPTQIQANIDFGSMSGSVKLNNFSAVNYTAKSDGKAVGSINNGGKNLSIHSVSGDIIIN